MNLAKTVSSFFDNLSTKRVALIFFAIGILIYANSLFNGFIGDDFHLIINNPIVHSVTNIPRLFTKGSFPEDVGGERNNYYKPLFSTAFSIIYLFSQENPFGFHLLQILLHITNSVLIFLILKHFFDKSISFFASLLFLTHPINAEAVIYISNLQEPLFMFFGLSALYLAAKETKNSTFKYSVVLLILASLLSKETGIVFLLIIPAFNFLYNRSSFLLGLTQSLSAFGIYSLLRFGIAQIYFSQHPVAPIMTLPFWERVINIPKIIFFYLKTFFYPRHLLAFQSWTVKSLNFPDFYLPVIIDSIFFLLVIISVVVIFKKNKELFKTVLFFLAWFLVGLGLHLQIIPLDQTVADRWFYFPIVGALGIIGVWAKYIKSDRKLGLVTIIVLIIVTIFSARVVVRNTNWKDRTTLFFHDIKYNQDSYQLVGGIASVYASQGKIKEAQEYYIRSTSLFPGMDTFSSLGAFYLLHDNFEGARDAFEKGLSYDSKNVPAWAYLAISKYKLGDRQGALEAANRAYSISSNKSALSILKAIENNEEIILH